MKLYIKYMVSSRCKMFVRETLDNIGLHSRIIRLGEVELLEKSITAEQQDSLRAALMQSGLELMEDKKAVLISKIKCVVLEMMSCVDELPKMKISAYIGKKLDYNYPHLANVFSTATGMTIDQYVIRHRIEKVKELILNDVLNLTEISYQLQYSSVAHLSAQFKKVTGLTPTYFKHVQIHKKICLSEAV